MTGETRPRGFTTRAVGGWKRVESSLRSRAASVPIYQAATFVFDDMEHFASVAESKIEGGYLYTRWANPTVDAVAATIADLEGAQATVCFASGMAAIAGTVTALVSSGDHIVSASQLYGGTHGLFSGVLARAGVMVTKVDVADHRAIEAAFTDRTKVLYCETIGNPTMNVADLAALSEIAHARGATFVVDATFTPPSLLRPIEHGVDLVCHSATKYLGGHADVTAGVVSGRAERIDSIHRMQLDTGGILAPMEAWLLGRGVQTLALRTDRICDNAAAIAGFLEGHRGVRRVLYPGLASHPDHGLAVRLLGARFGGMLSFDIGSAEAGRRVMERVRVAAPAASLGGTKTLVVHPASVTHTQLSAEERQAVGVTEGLVRVSVGIEDVEDLLADFDGALS